MSNEFFCHICDVSCSGKAPYEQHINSAKHIKRAKLNEFQKSSEQSNSPNLKRSSSTASNTTTSLSTPDDNITNELQYMSTTASTFSISPETMRILLEWNHPRGYQPFCDICQLVLHGFNNADTHFASNNRFHHEKLAVSKRIREGNAKYSCKVCSEIFTDGNASQQHFESSQHRDFVQQKDNLQKFIKIYEAYDRLKNVRRQRKSMSENIFD